MSSIRVPTFSEFRTEHAGEFDDFYMEIKWLKARDTALIHNAIEAGTTCLKHGDEIVEAPTWAKHFRDKQRELGVRIDQRSREAYTIHDEWKIARAAIEAKNVEIKTETKAILASYSAGLIGPPSQIPWAADIRSRRTREMTAEDRAFFVDQPSDAIRWIDGNRLTTDQFVETYRPLFVSDRKRRAA